MRNPDRSLKYASDKEIILVMVGFFVATLLIAALIVWIT